jgi:hypothetical protein
MVLQKFGQFSIAQKLSVLPGHSEELMM